MSAVAVVGLGAMGGRIAARLVDHGHDVVVWNRDRSKATGFAKVASSPVEAAGRAEATVIMVADPQALAAVTEGAEGVAAAESDVIQMSTVSPEATARLAAVVPPARLLDAPVLGSLAEVEAGTLNVFAAGDDDVVRKWTPLLSELGRVHHVGPVGAGTAAKLVANLTLFGALGVLGEALALADALGLRREAAFDVLAATPVAAQAERRRGVVEGADVPTRFSLALALKDAELIHEVGTSTGVDLRVAEAARTWLADAVAAGRGDADYSTVLLRILGGR